MALPSPSFFRKLNRPPAKKFFKKPHDNEKPSSSYCKYCNVNLTSAAEFYEHKRSHVKCPYEGCRFSAQNLVIAAHIQKVHIKEGTSSVKIQDLSTPEQIEKWREERRKRYPTTANVIIRQQIQEEKLKRGEKLQDSTKKFSDDKQKNYVNNLGRRDGGNRKFEKSHNRPNNKRRLKNEIRRAKDKKQHPVTTKDSSSDEEEKKVPRFRGTGQLKGYNTIETDIKEKPALALLGMYGSDSDEESDEDVTVESLPAETRPPVELKIEVEPQNDDPLDEQNDLQEEGPDEISIEKNPDAPEITHEPKAQTSRKRKHNDRPSSAKVARKNGLDYSRIRRTGNAFLEKLLEREIVHERNVLLQCVNYVVKNNFFGIGQEVSVSSDNVEEKASVVDSD